MLYGALNLLGAFFDGGIFNYVLRYIVALAFLATVPCIVREFWRK